MAIIIADRLLQCALSAHTGKAQLKKLSEKYDRGFIFVYEAKRGSAPRNIFSRMFALHLLSYIHIQSP
jgi:hypothetical protein